jgi:hypothetical protein
MLLQKRAQKLEKEFPSYFPQDEKDRLLDMVRTNHLEILFNNEEFNKKYTFYYDNLSFNDCLTMDMVLKNLDQKWELGALSDNLSITFEMIMEHKDIINWDWYFVSMNRNVTLQTIKDHPELPWDLHGLSRNKNIPFRYIEERMTEGFHLENSVNMTVKDMIKYRDVPTVSINWAFFSRLKCVTMKDIEEHPELQSNWGWISQNPNLTTDTIIKHQDKLIWYNVSSNEGVTMDFVEKYPDLPWNYETLSMNINLTIEMILRNLDKKWNWCHISRNPAMTLEIIMTYSHLPWEWRDVSLNPNLTSDFILNNPDKEWCIAHISLNPFHNYRREKKIIRARIAQVIEINRLMCEMMKGNTYFRELPKDVIDLISIYY